MNKPDKDKNSKEKPVTRALIYSFPRPLFADK